MKSREPAVTHYRAFPSRSVQYSTVQYSASHETHTLHTPRPVLGLLCTEPVSYHVVKGTREGEAVAWQFASVLLQLPFPSCGSKCATVECSDVIAADAESA